MNEHGYIRSIHRGLPPELYRWKISDRYTAGVADTWYSGSKADIWCEYKYLPRIPKRKFKNPLTALQREWLTGRTKDGRRVFAVIGCPAGAMILTTPDSWNQDTIQVERWTPKGGIISWITQQTMH